MWNATKYDSTHYFGQRLLLSSIMGTTELFSFNALFGIILEANKHHYLSRLRPLIDLQPSQEEMCAWANETFVGDTVESPEEKETCVVLMQSYLQFHKKALLSREEVHNHDKFL